MKVIKHILIFFLLLSITNINAQNKYWVFLSDKKNVSFNPYEYFDQKAIDRRINNNISLYDSSDFPLNTDYVNSISKNYKVLSQSRWFNAVAVEMNKKEADEIQDLDFVVSISPINTINNYLRIPKLREIIGYNNVSRLNDQIKVMQGDLFVKNGFDGTGVRIAVFDGGFPDVDNNKVFEHLHKDNRIIKTYDFVKKREFVYKYNFHGTMVLACIAGIFKHEYSTPVYNIGNNEDSINLDDPEQWKDSIYYEYEKMGLATGAEFLLARTETWTEFIAEEENWMAAMEWADKNGADIISSSLGYTYHRYFTTDMDGQTSLVVKAANMAAAKGMLVVNAMGNEGNKDWHIMCTPADGDSVLAVGGIQAYTNYHIDFSSYGPTVDLRMKPNVCAYGKVTTLGKKRLKTAFGTSFSTPLVTGFAACAWQAKPDLTNMELFKEIEKSGSLYPYYDYAHGFGVPQASYFTDSVRSEPVKTFEMEAHDYYLKIRVNDTIDVSSPNDYLYYHIENSEGVLERYTVIDMNGSKIETIDINNLTNKTIRIHYKSYTESYETKE